MSAEITYETDEKGRIKTIRLTDAPQWLDDAFTALGESMHLGLAARDNGDLEGSAALLRGAMRRCDLLAADERVELIGKEAFLQLRQDLAAAAPSEATYSPSISVPAAGMSVPPGAAKRVVFERDGSGRITGGLVVERP